MADIYLNLPKTIRVPIKSSLGASLELNGGLNPVSDDIWKEAKKLKVVQVYLSEGWLSEGAPKLLPQMHRWMTQAKQGVMAGKGAQARRILSSVGQAPPQGGGFVLNNGRLTSGTAALKDYSVDQSKEIIGWTNNADRLKAWLPGEQRKGVISALEARIKELDG